MRLICKPSWLCLCLSYDVYFFYLVNAFVLGISNVKSREDLVMSGSDSSDPFEKAPFKKPEHRHKRRYSLPSWRPHGVCCAPLVEEP